MTEITQHSSVHAPSWAPHQEPSQERAQAQLVLPGHSQAAIREALKSVSLHALLAEAAGDTDQARKALIATRNACVRAAELINDAEREVREAGHFKLEHAA